ncbi:MAG: arsenic transporter [Pseudonocardiales bacterium]|nr:MAG: arsenic transporter [Pseudonocardiales bacterium]
MSAVAAQGLAIGLLVALLSVAVFRPRWLPELAVSAAAAAVVLALGLLPPHVAVGEARSLGPTIGFLAAVLLLADMAGRFGLFAAAGSWMAAASRGRPVALLALVFVVGSVVTAILSLDATVVLLTPVVFATTAQLRLRPRPHVYACGHLANSASLLLPVSNLTNLLAFRASGLSFARFGAVMALPWLVAIAVEWVVLRRFFARDLAGGGGSEPERGSGLPVYPVAVIGLTLAGFFVTSIVHIDPAFAAAAGALALAVPALRSGRAAITDVGRALDVPFLVFVLALGLVVRAISDGGLGAAVDYLVPGGSSLGALLAVAVIAAALSNVINNLPAVLLLLPVVAHRGAGPVLAVLIGVNIGPNLTYVGSLATLLWRRTLRRYGAEPPTSEFTRLGGLTVVPALLAATAALWVSLRLMG